MNDLGFAFLVKGSEPFGYVGIRSDVEICKSKAADYKVGEDLTIVFY